MKKLRTHRKGAKDAKKFKTKVNTSYLAAATADQHHSSASQPLAHSFGSWQFLGRCMPAPHHRDTG